MCVLLKLAYLATGALSLAAMTASAAPADPMVLNNIASGARTGTAASNVAEKNRVIFAREGIFSAAAYPDIQILRKNDATNENEQPVATYPFAAFGECPYGKKTPVLVYPKTSMPELLDASSSPLRVYFACPTAANDPFGNLYTATSSDLGETWSTPTALALTKPVLLKGLAPMPALLSIPTKWILPAQTSDCSFTLIALDNSGTTVNDMTFDYCAESSGTAGHRVISSAAWTRALFTEGTTGNHLDRLVIFAVLRDGTAAAYTCRINTAFSCADNTLWITYRPSATTSIVDPVLPTGTSPSLLTVFNYRATSPAPSDNCLVSTSGNEGALPFLLGAQTAITLTASNSTASYLGFSATPNVSSVLDPTSRVLVGAPMMGSPNAAFAVVGIAVVPLLETSSPDGSCVVNWASLVSTVDAATNTTASPIMSTFTNAAFDPNSNNNGDHDDKDNGMPSLAAAITFIIVGTVVVLLATFFIVGFLKNRKKDYASIHREDLHAHDV